MRVLLIIVLVLLVLLLTPIRIQISFREVFQGRICYLFLRKKFDGGNEAEVPEEAEKEGDEGQESVLAKLKAFYKARGFHGFLTVVKELVKIAAGEGKGLLSHVRMKRARLYVCVTAEDAAAAAIRYGETCAFLYPGFHLLASYLHCKQPQVLVDLDYQREVPLVDFEGLLTIKPLFVLGHGIRALGRFVWLLWRTRPAAPEKDGKTESNE